MNDKKLAICVADPISRRLIEGVAPQLELSPAIFEEKCLYNQSCMRGVEMVVADEMVEKIVQAISAAARTGKIGDGKIFLSKIDDAVRIRNDERGEGAL